MNKKEEFLLSIALKNTLEVYFSNRTNSISRKYNNLDGRTKINDNESEMIKSLVLEIDKK